MILRKMKKDKENFENVKNYSRDIKKISKNFRVTD